MRDGNLYLGPLQIIERILESEIWKNGKERLPATCVTFGGVSGAVEWASE